MEAGLVSDATEMASGYRFYRRRLQGFMVPQTSTKDTEHTREPQLTNSDLTRSLQGCGELGVWGRGGRRGKQTQSHLCVFLSPSQGCLDLERKKGKHPGAGEVAQVVQSFPHRVRT